MLNRRHFLSATAATAGVLATPAILRAQEVALKVGAYGGYFQDSFDEYIYPDFTAATGIEVESIAEPTGDTWLVQLQQAARANQAPADVSMMTQVARLKGEATGLWQKLDEARIPNLGNLPDHFIHRYPDGSLLGAGAVSWYITLVTNTDAYPEGPDSWQALWDPANRDRVGLMSQASNSFLLEITAATYFGGTDILGDDDGVLQVMETLAGLKPNVVLWWRDEGQFQQAVETGEVPMGQYYHDVAGVAASQGKPVRSVFPKEGAILDSGSWVVTTASTMVPQAEEFINYMAQPEVQEVVARKLGSAPTVKRELLTGMSDEEFAVVSSDIPPIIPRYDLYVDRADWVNQQWAERITG